MNNERSLLRELDEALRIAWDKRILPADAVPAELVRRVKQCLAAEPQAPHVHSFNDGTDDCMKCQCGAMMVTPQWLASSVGRTLR